MNSFFLQDVPLSHIRHNDLPCYRNEGFGARPIEDWPVYAFFKQYVEGDREKAQQNFENWYKDQLSKYYRTPKSEGGMYKGSLYALVEKKCGAPFSEVDELCREEAIRERVRQRFDLLENIKTYGYKLDTSERIDAVKKNGSVYLLGGHHRAAALRALGNEVLPQVFVFPNEFIYNLFCFLRNMAHGNF